MDFQMAEYSHHRLPSHFINDVVAMQNNEHHHSTFDRIKLKLKPN